MIGMNATTKTNPFLATKITIAHPSFGDSRLAAVIRDARRLLSAPRASTALPALDAWEMAELNAVSAWAVELGCPELVGVCARIAGGQIDPGPMVSNIAFEIATT